MGVAAQSIKPRCPTLTARDISLSGNINFLKCVINYSEGPVKNMELPK
jgi:hypothetical protein